ncbi:hypothetical protein ACWPOB_27535 [Rhodococcus sp. 2H158]
MCGVNGGGEATGVGDVGGAGVRVVRTTTSVRVEATIPASAAALFGVMRDPLRHSEIDGSGTVHVPAGQPPITAAGLRFFAPVHFPGRTAYPVVNHVVAFEPDRCRRGCRPTRTRRRSASGGSGPSPGRPGALR